MRLQDYLEQTGEVSAYDLADAERRARIYGGSVDTALLELELLGPIELDAALACARGLLACPPELLVQTSARRPWDMLPTAWIGDLQAVPLAVIEDRLWVALHPEVTDETISTVQGELPGAALTITAECWIRVLADQHRKTATPPRYASLAARYLHAIRSAGDPLTEESVTLEVTEAHHAFLNEASGLLSVPVDDDDDEPAIDLDKTGPLRQEQDETATENAAADTASDTASELSDTNGEGDPSEDLEDAQTQPFAPVIPGLRRAPQELPTDEMQELHTLGESPPFIPTLLHGAAPTAAPVLPELRKSRADSTVIPSLQPPSPAQIPDLTRRAPDPVEPAPVPTTTKTETDDPAADDPAADDPKSAAIIPALQRPSTDEAPPEPDSPMARRRKPSSGYVPQTLIHHRAQASTIDPLVSSAIAAGGRRPEHTEQLIELGEDAFIRIAQLFPGPLDLPRGDLKNLPTASAHGPLLRLCIAIGGDLTPFILARLGDPDPNVRFYVVLIFQELRSSAAVGPLARLAFDPDRDIRTIAMRVLETYHDDPSYNRAALKLRRELTSPTATRRQRAIQAMGTLRDVGAVGKLIDALDDGEIEIAAAALTALCSISGQHLGMGSPKWRRWHEDNRERSRIEWMIDSLEHRDPAVRRWASEELLRITTVSIPFDPHGEEAQRGQAVARWRAWAQTPEGI